MMLKYPLLRWLTSHGWTVTHEAHAFRWRDVRPYRTVYLNRAVPYELRVCPRPHIDDDRAFGAAWVAEFGRRWDAYKTERDAVTA